MSANKWNQVEIDLQTHDKFIDLLDRLDVEPDDVVASDHVQVSLERLWGHVLKNDPVGSFTTTPRKLHRICKYRGEAIDWLAALVESGFLDVDDEGWASAGPRDEIEIEIHNWWDRVGRHLPGANDSANQGRIRQAVRRAIHGRTPTWTAIVERDGHRCRVCGQEVQWEHLRRPNGGSLALIDRTGELTVANAVVRCFACKRTPPTGDGGGPPVPTTPPDPAPATALRNSNVTPNDASRYGDVTDPVALRHPLRERAPSPKVPGKPANDSPKVPDSPVTLRPDDPNVTSRYVTPLPDQTVPYLTIPDHSSSSSATVSLANGKAEEDDDFLRKANGEPPKTEGGPLLGEVNIHSPGLRRTRESSQYLKTIGRTLSRRSREWSRINPVFTEDWLADTLMRAESQAGPVTKEYLLDRMDETKDKIARRAPLQPGQQGYLVDIKNYATTVLINAITGKGKDA